MKLVYFETTSADEQQLRTAKENLEVVLIPAVLKEDSIPNEALDAEIISVFVDSRVTAAVLEKLPQLKLIATRSTGFDHIDLEVCKQRGIVVANVPSYGENTVAEHAFALILALSRKVFQSFERTEHMNFNRDGLEGFDLKGKTLGVVGCGRIGKNSVQIGRGFGMEVIAQDMYPDLEFAAKVGCRYADSLDDLLSNSDVITIHAPYMPETHHMINAENVKKIKPGAILVNTARGGLVDTSALLWALDNKILSGVGLDVLEDEEDTFDHITLLADGFPKDTDIAALLRNHILIDRTDVIITPHNAFNSKEAKQRIFDTNMDNIVSFVAGAPKNNVVK